MQRNLLYSFALAGALVCFQPGGAMWAQMPSGGGGGQSPSGGQQPSGGGQPGAAGQPGGMAQPGQAPSEAPMPKKVDDKKFAKDAAVGGLLEIEMGKVAAQKGSTDAVKQYGQKLVDDHTKANDQLKQIASQENLTLPTSLDSKQQAKVDKLSSLSGGAFDKAFIKEATKDHQHDISMFKEEQQGGSDPNIKQFASSTLPTLQEHLEAAKNLHKQEKKQMASTKQ